MGKRAYFSDDDKKIKPLKLIYLVLGLFATALIYNSVFVPNDIVIGGVSGLAIIIKRVFGIDTSLFIAIANIALIIVGFMFLGKKDTFKQILGSAIYTFMISFTAPLANMIDLKGIPVIILFLGAALIYGFANGIVYRAGYATGGFDILIQILSNKFKKPITSIGPILNGAVILIAGIAFSPVKIMYAVMIIFISNRVTNGILYSISTSKMIYIISRKNVDIENYIMRKFNSGATEIRVHSGLFEKRKHMVMCIIHNSQYHQFKKKILNLDPNAFIVAKTCFSVSGGMRYEILPF